MKKDNATLYKMLVFLILLVIGNSFFSTSIVTRLNTLKQKELNIEKLAIETVRLDEISSLYIHLFIESKNDNWLFKYQDSKLELEKYLSKMRESTTNLQTMKDISKAINMHLNIEIFEKKIIKSILNKNIFLDESFKKKYQIDKNIYRKQLEIILKDIENQIGKKIEYLEQTVNIIIFTSSIIILLFIYIIVFIFLKNRLNSAIIRASESKFYKLMNRSSDAILLIDDDMNIVDTNTKFLKLSKYPKKELLNRAIKEFFSKDSSKDIKLSFLEILDKGYCFPFEAKLIDKNSTNIYVELKFSKFRQMSKEVVLIILKDLTEQKLKSKELTFTRQYLSTLLDSQPNAIIVLNNKKIESANSAFFKLFDKENILDSFYEEFLPISNILQKVAKNKTIFNNHGEFNWVDYILRNPQKQHKITLEVKKRELVFAVNIKRFIYENQIRDIINLTDITDIEHHQVRLKELVKERTKKLCEANNKLKEQASIDALTQIYNRAKFDEIWQEELFKAKKFKSKLSVIMFDIDFFKKINDNYGHLVGDETLKQLCKCVQKSIRDSDNLFRWGGEEFVILASNTPLNIAIEITTRIQKDIKNTDFKEIGSITCSFGISEYRDSENELLSRVDKALYLAKERGRDRIEIL